MFLKQLKVEGYKGIAGGFTVNFQKGLNVLVGENASGKSTVIDAVRLLLREDEFGFSPISSSDFYKGFSEGSKSSESFTLRAEFGGLSEEEYVAFLPWTDFSKSAFLTYHVDNKEVRGRYKRSIWGGASKASSFEWDLFDTINCVYLPPLRDATAKLREGKGSRLARLLKTLEATTLRKLSAENDRHPLEKKVQEFNQQLVDDVEGAIATANALICNRLEKAIGKVYGQSTAVQFAEVDFCRIVERLRLFFFPDVTGAEKSQFYRALEENSLGYNNLLYLATVLAELSIVSHQLEFIKVLLIEEPEAHLHPQLQIALLKHLEKISAEEKVQVIVTTHSPVLASSVSLETVIHFSNQKNGKIKTTVLNNTALAVSDSDGVISMPFISRWLDATKSTLLFAKGIILVEGLAEALLIPELARNILKERDDVSANTLEEAFVSVINMGGIYFKHFMKLFCSMGLEGGDIDALTYRCAGLTDNDPPTDTYPYEKNMLGKNPALKLIDVVNETENVRLYAGQFKTFEYDLAMEGENARYMLSILIENWPTNGSVKKELEDLAAKDISKCSVQEKSDIAKALLYRIDDTNMGKGYFAQLLAEKLKSKEIELAVPAYIVDAVIWACGGVYHD